MTRASVSAVTTLPPAFSADETELSLPSKRSDPVSLQSIQHAWASDSVSSSRSLDLSLPRPILEALNASAAATEVSNRILNHTQPDDSSVQPHMDNSALIALIAELRSQLLNHDEQSRTLLMVASKRGEDISAELSATLMEKQAEQDAFDQKLRLVREEEESRRRSLDASLSDMKGQLARTTQSHEAEIEKLKKELQSISIADKEEAGLKGLKAVRVVEDKLEKSENARRMAERKATSLEQDLISMRTQLDSKSRDSYSLATQLATEKESNRQLRLDFDAKVKAALEEGKAQSRKQVHSLEVDKKSLAEAKDKLEADLGKRTQTLLAAQADLDALKMTVKDHEAKIAQLVKENEGLKLIVSTLRMELDVQSVAQLDAKARVGVMEGDRPWQQATPPRPPPSNKRPTTASPLSQQSSDTAKLQQMLMDLKEEYCQRLVYLEGELQRAETSASTYASQLDRMASGLAARTAILFKSRLTSNQASFNLPSSSASSVNGDFDSEGPRVKSGKSQVSKGILQQMNEKLTSENAALLVEVARLQANQVKSKLASRSSNGGPLPPSSPCVAQDALNVVMKEALLSSRNKNLALVLTAEGWEGSSMEKQSSFHLKIKGPGDIAIDAAEEDIRSRVSSLALMAELRALKIDLHEASTRLSAHANLESELLQVKMELARAEARIRSMETESRMIRTGMSHDDVPVSAQPVYDDKMEDKVRSAKDEAHRHKLLASAAKREKDLMDQELEESRRRIHKLEGQVKETRSDAAKSDEANKRLRSILLQAKALLKEAGVDFLEDASYESLGLGGKGSTRSSEAGSVARQSSDGTLFKALDQRDKDREMSRMQREVNEAQYQANVAGKELKKMKTQLSQAQLELQREKEARERQVQPLVVEVDELKVQKKKAEDEKRVVEVRCTEMKKELDTSKSSLSKVSMDLNYLQARIQGPRPKPKLSYAVALALSVTPQ
jgi:hypothetical protein